MRFNLTADRYLNEFKNSSDQKVYATYILSGETVEAPVSEKIWHTPRGIGGYQPYKKLDSYPSSDESTVTKVKTMKLVSESELEGMCETMDIYLPGTRLAIEFGNNAN